MEELMAASGLLKLSISRYVNACSVAVKACTPLNNCNVGPDPTLLDCITRELQATIGYIASVQDVKLALSRCINSAHTIVPINTLPPEVLARIFELIYSPNSCSPNTQIHGQNIERAAELAPPIPSIILSHVCVRWREISLGLPTLWSRFTVATSDPRELFLKQVMVHGKALARSGSLDTDLRIDVSPDTTLDTYILPTLDKLGQLLSDADEKSYRLRLYNWAREDIFCGVLERILASLVPTTLKQLTLMDHPAARSSRVENALNRFPATEKTIRQHLPSLTALHLVDVGIQLSSHVYSGLNDLRLIASRICDDFVVSLPQLRAILLCFPSLRIFHFGYLIALGIIPYVPPPVPLHELEELNIRGMVGSPELILKLISPGSKPMSLSVAADFDREWFAGSIPAPVLTFLERSNVTGLHVDCGNKYGDFPLCSLLRGPFTKLRVLGLRGFMLDQRINSTTVQSSPNRLDFLHLHNCGLDLEILQEFLSACTVSTMKVCGHTLGDNQEIAALVPNIIVCDQPDPRAHVTTDWEYWETPSAAI